MTKPFILAAALLAAGTASAEFKPVAHASLMGGYAATVGSRSSGLLNAGLNLVPAWRQGSLTLLPALTLNSGGQERSIEEGTIFVRSATLQFRPRLRFDGPQGGRWGVNAQALRTWNMETLNETIGNGLYDYEQFGAGLEGELPIPALGGRLKSGLDFAHRSYPNNRNFAAAVALTGDKNFYFKDFNSISASLGLELEEARASVSYRPEIRFYTDSLLVLESGILDAAKLRQDQLHVLSFEIERPLGKSLAATLAFDLRINASNQSYFDRLAAVPTFVPNSEDYISESLRVDLPWKADRLWQGLVLVPGLSVEFVHTNKPVQDAVGAYGSDKIQQQNFGANLKAEKELAWGLSWVSDGALRVARSSQAFQRGLLNNYEYWQLSTGLSYKFKPGPAGEKAPPGAKPTEFSVVLKSFPKGARQEVLAALQQSLGIGLAQAEGILAKLPAGLDVGPDIRKANEIFVNLHVSGADVELKAVAGSPAPAPAGNLDGSK